MSEHIEQEGQEVASGNSSVTITPNTGVSIGMILTIIGAAIWITNGQARLEARSQRLEELVVDLRSSVAATSGAAQATSNRLADHEAWAKSEAVRIRMALNEERRKVGLSPLPDINPYQDTGHGGSR